MTVAQSSPLVGYFCVILNKKKFFVYERFIKLLAGIILCMSKIIYIVENLNGMQLARFCKGPFVVYVDILFFYEYKDLGIRKTVSWNRRPP